MRMDALLSCVNSGYLALCCMGGHLSVAKFFDDYDRFIIIIISIRIYTGKTLSASNAIADTFAVAVVVVMMVAVVGIYCFPALLFVFPFTSAIFIPFITLLFTFFFTFGIAILFFAPLVTFFFAVLLILLFFTFLFLFFFLIFTGGIDHCGRICSKGNTVK